MLFSIGCLQWSRSPKSRPSVDVIPYPAIVFLPVGAGRVPYRPVTSEKFVRASRRACISTAGRWLQQMTGAGPVSCLRSRVLGRLRRGQTWTEATCKAGYLLRRTSVGGKPLFSTYLSSHHHAPPVPLCAPAPSHTQPSIPHSRMTHTAPTSNSRSGRPAKWPPAPTHTPPIRSPRETHDEHSGGSGHAGAPGTDLPCSQGERVQPGHLQEGHLVRADRVHIQGL